MYPFHAPSLMDELQFAQQCTMDTEMAEFDDQKKWALSYQVYISEQVQKHWTTIQNNSNLPLIQALLHVHDELVPMHILARERALTCLKELSVLKSEQESEQDVLNTMWSAKLSL